MQNERSWTEINLSHFERNLNELKKFISAGTDFMQIVKADAYGHGAFEISRKAILCGATSLGVANVQEGMLLRYQGIDTPILILSPSLESEIELIMENELIPTISYLEFAQTLDKKAMKKIGIHINIDTGMGRSGIQYKQALATISKIRQLPNLKIEGIFSHFSAAENDADYSKLQSERFKGILDELDIKPRYVHIANSSGVITSKDDYSNLVRLGLLSYGVYTDPSLKNKIKLIPVMTFKSRIGQIKTAEKGESIGYNRTYTAPGKMKYAILPVGYADGYDFMLSNKGKVLIKNKLCDVIGKVSMDMIAVDVTHVNANVEDEVVLLGNEHDAIKAENLTSLYNGSSYEILCQVGRRAKRYYYENGKMIASSPLLRRDFVSSDYSDDKLNTVIETAIEQRLQSKEISSLIYSDILKRFFTERDRDIHYRRNFKHTIEFKDSTSSPFSGENTRGLDNSASSPFLRGNKRGLKDYYLTNTTLTFTKQLQNDHFYVACANSEKLLEKYFLRKDVEYRWLLDNKLEANLFDVTSAKINDIELYHEMKLKDGCLEIHCHHPQLKELVGKEVEFSISTQTFYPKDSHQLSVYLIEMTQGVKISFVYGEILKNVEAVPIFSGRSKFPQIEEKKGIITISSQPNEWVFPTSGVVFVY